MNKPATLLGLLLILSVALNSLLISRFVISDPAPEALDQRRPLVLEESEREVILEEMRGFLLAVQGIVQAVQEEDMELAADHAHAVGTVAAAAAPASLAAKLPMEFKMLGRATHQAFDTLAMDARSLGDGTHALEQLGRLMNNCISCHANFQIRLAPPHP